MWENNVKVVDSDSERENKKVCSIAATLTRKKIGKIMLKLLKQIDKSLFYSGDCTKK